MRAPDHRLHVRRELPLHAAAWRPDVHQGSNLVKATGEEDRGLRRVPANCLDLPRVVRQGVLAFLKP